MAAKETPAVARAVERALQPGVSILEAARLEKVAASSVKRALRRRGVAPRPAISGQQHHAYIDGRSASRKR